MKSVQTSNMKSKGEEVNAEIGAQNVFSLLKIGIGANRKNNDSEEETVIEEKTHRTGSMNTLKIAEKIRLIRSFIQIK